jgi:hypothetical protein
MKIKIQITVESNNGQLNVFQEVAHLDRGTLRPETLGLTLAEARSILAGIEQTVVEQQAAEFIAQQRACSHCGHERSCKGRHHIVFRTPFGKLRLESPRLYHCQCESDDRTSFSPLAELLQERSSPELIYLETKFAACFLRAYSRALEGGAPDQPGPEHDNDQAAGTPNGPTVRRRIGERAGHLHWRLPARLGSASGSGRTAHRWNRRRLCPCKRPTVASRRMVRGDRG